ncbi:MAG: radical SAM protein [Halobacteriota archaeon]
MPKICLYCARYDIEPQIITHLGIEYIAAYLIQQGIVSEDEIRIVDTLDEALEFKPDILGVSSTSQVISYAKEFAKKSKEKVGCLTVLGGYHITAIPKMLPNEFDIGVLGEGEITFAEIVSLFKANRLPEALSQIKGICYRQNGENIINEPRELIKDLDSLPLPYRHNKYLKEVPIFTSRGCPYNCIFCASHGFWRGKYRKRSADSVVSEIVHLVNSYSSNRIVINMWDDLWMADKTRFQKMVQKLVALRIPEKTSFMGFCRSNLIYEEEIKLLKKLNYKSIRFGAETGSEPLLTRLKGNNISIADHQRVIDLCQKYKMPCGASFMFGVPGETKEDLEATIAFLRKNKEKLYIDGFYFFNPIPGTEIWKEMKSKKIISDEFTFPFEILRLDFQRKNFSWDNILYFNQENVPLVEFRKIINRIKTEFIDVELRRKAQEVALSKKAQLLEKYFGKKITQYARRLISIKRKVFKKNNKKTDNKILVEVGTGNSPQPGYIHCDICPLKCVEYVCNAWAIPFKSESVDEIYSRHMLEHLTYKQAKRTLKHWLCVLKVGGHIDINVPDLEKHIEQLYKDGYSQYVKNATNKEHAMAGFYGWQNSEHDIHKWGYTFETLSKLLSEIGYSNIRRIEDTSNAGHLNLRIIAEKDKSFPDLKLDSESLKLKGGYYNWNVIIKNWEHKIKKSIKTIFYIMQRLNRYRKSFVNSTDHFDLCSGERQTAPKIENIRADHLNRYELVVKYINHFFANPDELFGLDIFSGVGYGTFLLNQKLGCVMIGIEGSKDAVNFAKKHYDNSSILLAQKIFPFYLPKETFDFIVCIESIEHVKEYELFFKNISYALKENAYLFLSVPNEKVVPLNVYKDDFNYHHKHFTKEKIEEYCKRNGLRVISTWGQNLYKLRNGKILQTLVVQDMKLIENKEGQINVYILKKESNSDDA